jgi:hypothetical protein
MQARIRAGMPLANAAREAYLSVPHQTWADRQTIAYPMLKGTDRHVTYAAFIACVIAALVLACR